MLIHDANVVDIIIATGITILAIMALAAATEGFLFARITRLLRAVLIAGGILLIFPYWLAMGAGLALMVGVGIFQYLKKRNGYVVQA